MLDEQKVKNLLSREVITYLDGPSRRIFQEIAFNPENKINWDEVYKMIMSQMSELKKYPGYSEENMKSNEQPYLTKTIKIKAYNPKYGDDKKCKCGHSYYRHFDCWESMEACGCKYCECDNFVFEGVD